MHHFARDGRVGQKGRHKSSPARIFMTPLRPPPKSAIHFIRALMTAAPYGYTYTARPEIIFTRREINYISDESCYRGLYHGTVAGWWKLRFYEYPLFQKRNTAFINNRNIDPTTNSSLSASEVFYYLFTESTFYLWNIKIARESATTARPNVTLQMKARYFYLANARRFHSRSECRYFSLHLEKKERSYLRGTVFRDHLDASNVKNELFLQYSIFSIPF